VVARQFDDAQRRYEEILDHRETSPAMRDLALRNLAVVALRSGNPGKAYA
jgi:uncharacterized membrane-anchored protein